MALVYPPTFLDVARRFDLRPAAMGTIRALDRPRTMSEIATVLRCDNSNVTGIVDRLEARGLVRRAADPADRRVKTVLLTPEGEEAVRRIRADIVTGLPGLARLDADDRRALQDLLDRAFPRTTGPGPAAPHPSG
jgi:DNA-binding MarR family transcriptional regulator